MLKHVGGGIGQQCEELVFLGRTASLSSSHPLHTFIHHLINLIFLVITHVFNPSLTHCLLPLHSFHFYNPPHPSLSHPFSSFFPTFSLSSPLLARVARQCSSAICQRSMPTASCPRTHSPTDAHKHTHSLARAPSRAGYTDIHASATRSLWSHAMCITQTHTHTAPMSHTLHLSPNRGSRGASAGAETGERLLLQ